jgi:hypothetical protein
MIDISCYQQMLKLAAVKFTAMKLKVFGCELPEDGDQPQPVGAS